MALAWRATGALAGADSGNVASVGLPAGHTTDDILVLHAVQFDNVASTVTGWTLIASQTNGTSMTTRVFAKRDNGAESAPTLTHASGGVVHCAIHAISGVDNTLAVATPGAGSVFRDAQSQTGSTASETFPSLTGTVAADLEIALLTQTGNDTSGAAANNWSAQPIGFTERFDNGRVSLGAGHSVAEVNTKVGTAASGSNTGNATGFAGTINWIGFQICISSDVGTPATVAPGDAVLFSDVSGPGVDYGPYAFIEDRAAVPSGPLTVLQDVTATAVAVTASMVKQVGKLLTATSVAVTASIAALKTKLQAMTATTVVVTASMVKQVNKSLTATTVAVTASILKQVNKLLTATSLVVTASIATIKVKLLTMTATTVAVTASMTRLVGKTLTAASVAVSASAVKQVGKRFTATAVVATASLTTIKVKLVAMAATAVVVTASMLRRVNTTLSATSSVTASVVKAIAHRLTNATVAVTATMVAQFGVVAQFFQKAFDAVLGHPRVHTTPEDTDYTSDPKGKMGSDPHQTGFD